MRKRYIHEGFEALSKGDLGNGGRNLYVSRKGVLQRIFNFDTTGNGYADHKLSLTHIAAGDIDGDGCCDLYCRIRGGDWVVIFWGGPEGYSSSRCCELPSYQSNNIIIADLNSDGYLDIFVSSYFNGRERDINSYIYWNDRGNFSVTHRRCIFAHSSSGSLACDLNEDGYVDLIVSNHRSYGSHRAYTAIWWNTIPHKIPP